MNLARIAALAAVFFVSMTDGVRADEQITRYFLAPSKDISTHVCRPGEEVDFDGDFDLRRLGFSRLTITCLGVAPSAGMVVAEAMPAAVPSKVVVSTTEIVCRRGTIFQLSTSNDHRKTALMCLEREPQKVRSAQRTANVRGQFPSNLRLLADNQPYAVVCAEEEIVTDLPPIPSPTDRRSRYEAKLGRKVHRVACETMDPEVGGSDVTLERFLACRNPGSVLTATPFPDEANGIGRVCIPSSQAR